MNNKRPFTELNNARMKEGINNFKQRDYKNAQIRFNEVLELDPMHPDALIWQGDVLTAMGNIHGARLLYDKAYLNHPNHVKKEYFSSTFDLQKYDDNKKKYLEETAEEKPDEKA